MLGLPLGERKSINTMIIKKPKLKRWVVLAFLYSLSIYSQNIRVHDPVAIKQGNTFYLFSTGRGISVFSSKDLVSWETEPSVFSEKPTWTDAVVPEFKNHIWAPDIVFHDSKYYLYYSISAFGKNTSAIGVATNTTLNSEEAEYHWKDHGIVIQSVPNRDLWNAIDPNLIFDEEQIPWLSFGSFWSGLKMVKLSKDLLSISQPEEWHTIARRDRNFELADANPGNAALEAPFIFKKNEYYYLFISWDYCCRGLESTYKIVVGRSKKATGPFEDMDGKSLFSGGGTMVLEGNKNYAGLGHNSVYTFDGKDYMFFHAYDVSDEGKPKLRIKEITWKNNWPTVTPVD